MGRVEKLTVFVDMFLVIIQPLLEFTAYSSGIVRISTLQNTPYNRNIFYRNLCGGISWRLLDVNPPVLPLHKFRRPVILELNAGGARSGLISACSRRCRTRLTCRPRPTVHAPYTLSTPSHTTACPTSVTVYVPLHSLCMSTSGLIHLPDGYLQQHAMTVASGLYVPQYATAPQAYVGYVPVDGGPTFPPHHTAHAPYAHPISQYAQPPPVSSHARPGSQQTLAGQAVSQQMTVGQLMSQQEMTAQSHAPTQTSSMQSQSGQTVSSQQPSTPMRSSAPAFVPRAMQQVRTLHSVARVRHLHTMLAAGRPPAGVLAGDGELDAAR